MLVRVALPPPLGPAGTTTGVQQKVRVTSLRMVQNMSWQKLLGDGEAWSGSESYVEIALRSSALCKLPCQLDDAKSHWC